MKIAVFHNLPSGGAKRSLYGFIKYLASVGNSIEVYIPETADEKFLPLKDAGAKLHVFPGVRPRRSRGILFSRQRHPAFRTDRYQALEENQRKIAETINSSDADVVLIEQDQFTMSPFILRYISKPMVYCCQQPAGAAARAGDASRDLWRRLFISLKSILRRQANSTVWRIDRENASFAPSVLANSFFSQEKITASYGRKPQVSYLGIDTSLFKPHTAEREHYVLTVGVCRPAKGFDFLIRALAVIKKSERPSLIIVSNRSSLLWKSYLKMLAVGKGVRLTILTALAEHALVRLYQRAKLVVYAPHQEPFGFVPLEAMACGTPVVAVHEGGPVETVSEGVTGLLTVRDECAFSAAVTKLLKDDRLREQMGACGIVAVREKWTLSKAGQRLAEHLEKTIRLQSDPLGRNNTEGIK